MLPGAAYTLAVTALSTAAKVKNFMFRSSPNLILPEEDRLIWITVVSGYLAGTRNLEGGTARTILLSACSVAGFKPLVGLFLGFFTGHAIALLQAPDKIIAAAGHILQIVVGQFSPLFPNVSLELLPFAFYLVPIHIFHSSRSYRARRRPE
jgi:hypothetical protein